MTLLYSPYYRDLSCVCASNYIPPVGVKSATIQAELHDTPDNHWAHTPELVGTVSGIVKIAGDVIVGAKVVLMSEIDDVPVAYRLTGADGRFEFTDLNTTMKFYVMVKLPSGWQNWEYMVSSRRNPV